ncbi:SRPBCC family protein [Nocardia miyunensis]|uniref:SRPBCC family protein n=1 Tax=Nocardia miyunensis TaxID=282684 RepID=UPI0008375628|nr:SRPBCC family protein [Nocardia miyunensis]
MEWTGAKYADGPTAEVEIWIDAPPRRVWEIVSDITLMPQFSDELKEANWVGEASGPAVGNTFLGSNSHPALGEWQTTSHVVECDAPRTFAWAVSDPDNPTATWRFTLEPRDGGTVLRQWMRMGPARSGLSLAIDRMPDKEEKIVFVRMREFESGMTGTVAAIKARAEAS